MYNFTEEERNALKKFRTYVCANQIAPHLEENVIRDGSVWCAGWWTMEMLGFMIEGEEEYQKHPLPYLNENRVQVRPNLIREVEQKFDMINLVKEHKDFSDTLMVCECGYGMDIALCATVKSWKKIITYDHVEFMGKKLHEAFPDLPIEFTHNNTHYLDFTKR